MAKLALLGGRRTVTAKSVSPVWPRFSKKAIAAVVKLLETGGGISTGRSKIVADAERAFADYHGVKHAMAVGSGTAALHAAVLGCGIEPGAEVITSPYSWGSTTACLLHSNIVPTFADVEEQTGLLAPASVEQRIGPRTRGIMVVHIYGQPADMRSLRRIAKKHNLALMEDCSQAHGAAYRGKRVGSLGDAAGFSCMGYKLLGTTEMGMMLTNSRATYERALLFSQHHSLLCRKPTPRGPGVHKALYPYVDALVYSYRTTDIDCVLLLDQLVHLTRWNKARTANRNALVDAIGDIEFVRAPVYPKWVDPVYHMATFRYDERKAGGVTRESFMTALSAEGAGASVYIYSPIPLWARMNARGYTGPSAPWLPMLRKAGVRYSAKDIPICMKLSEKTSFQMFFNALTEPEPELMQQYAKAFHKVAENMDALREWQKKQHRP